MTVRSFRVYSDSPLILDKLGFISQIGYRHSQLLQGIFLDLSCTFPCYVKSVTDFLKGFGIIRHYSVSYNVTFSLVEFFQGSRYVSLYQGRFFFFISASS